MVHSLSGLAWWCSLSAADVIPDYLWVEERALHAQLLSLSTEGGHNVSPGTDKVLKETKHTRIQALVYDILPPTAAIIDYAIVLGNLPPPPPPHTHTPSGLTRLMVTCLLRCYVVSTTLINTQTPSTGLTLTL